MPSPTHVKWPLEGKGYSETSRSRREDAIRLRNRDVRKWMRGTDVNVPCQLQVPHRREGLDNMVSQRSPSLGGKCNTLCKANTHRVSRAWSNHTVSINDVHE